MLRGIYDWVMGRAAHPKASLWLFIIAFAESSFFPIPPHIMLIPMVIANRDKAWRYAAIVTVGLVLGGIAGYFIGYGLFEQFGQPVRNFYGMGEKFAAFARNYNDYGAWIVFTVGVMPFPCKVITTASGAMGRNFWVFMLASVAARSLVFFVIAGLLFGGFIAIKRIAMHDKHPAI